MPAGILRRGVRIRHDAAHGVFEVTLEFHNEGRKTTEAGVSHCRAVVVIRSESVQGKTMTEIFEEAFAHFDSAKHLL